MPEAFSSSPPTINKMSGTSPLIQYKYHILVGGYTFITALAILRVNRQPYSSSVKAEQIETVFKGTTLGALVLGIGLSGRINRPRSTNIVDRST